MIHTAYAFAIESKVGKADVAHEDIDNGCLIKLLQRGLQYMELEANADSATFEVLTAADILKAKSTEQLKHVVREKREERDTPEDQPAPRQFEEGACRTVTTAQAFSATWNPVGTKLATYVHENTAQIWTAGSTLEYQNREPMIACPLVHGPKTASNDSVIVTQLIWAPDGYHVTTGCSDGTICTWSSSGDRLTV
jgi:WD40 repeat protein